MPWKIEGGFDLDGFLAQPLVARLATTGPHGPRVRPVWYVWEEQAFWWLTGPWSRLAEILANDPRVALVVDSCDIATGEVKSVTATGEAEIVPFDADRAKRKLAKYLGPDVTRWDPRFLSSWNEAARTGSDEDPNGIGVLRPRTLRAGDASFKVRR